MRRIVKVEFEGAFPLYEKNLDTVQGWRPDLAKQKTAKKKGPKGEMVPAPDAVAEDSIGLVFTVYDRNGNRFIRRAPWAKIKMVEYDETE